MSRAFAEGDQSEVVRSFSYGVRIGAVFSGFASMVFLVLALPISKLLVPSLSLEDVGIVGWIVRWQALGYFGLTVALLAKRLYFAHHQPKRAFWIALPIALLQLGSAIALQWMVTPQHLAEAIALAIVLISGFSAIVYFIDLHRFLKSSLDMVRIVIVMVKCFIAGFFTFLVGAILTLLWMIELDSNYFLILLQTALVGLVMLLTYFGILKLLRTQETEYYTEKLRKFFHPKNTKLKS
jgi:putative peptidoglycan lipid II flippase